MFQAQGIYKPILTSSDGETWTPRNVPFSVALNNTIATDGNTVLGGNGTALYRSDDGGITWNTAFLGSQTALQYNNGVWMSSTHKSTDLINWSTIGSQVSNSYVDNGYVTGYFGTNKVFGASGSSAPLLSQFGKLPSGVIPNNKPLIVKGDKVLAPITRSEATYPWSLAEIPIYSYNTATTFFVPPMAGNGAGIAYIYAGPNP